MRPAGDRSEAGAQGAPTADVLAAHGARTPDRPALIEGERRLSWRESIDWRDRLAHGLRRVGIVPGEHVVIYAPNGLETALAPAAVRAAGALPVPMNHRLVGEEIAYILNHADAAAVLVGETFLARGRTSSPGAPPDRPQRRPPRRQASWAR